MKLRIALVICALALAGCDQQPASSSSGANAPQLDSPAPDTEPTRTFDPVNDAARTATGAHLSAATTTQLPPAGQAGADQQEVLTLTGANGLTVAGVITGAVSPATQVGGQTLRALLALPVDEAQVLVYRVSAETKPAGGGGLCGADAAAFVVVWDPETPGVTGYKVLGLTGGQPGAANAHACPMLEYHEN